VSFDVIAPHYRWLEFVLAGEKLQRCRTSFLHGLAAPDRVLIVGEGNGRFLAECRRAFPAAAVTCVDACAGMLSRADRRLHRLGLNRDGIEWVHADALAWRPPPAG
jgi:ubiquinone/menaquinone biosynthesis C-methylase UbiE